MFVHVIISRLESLVQTFEVAPVFILFLVCSIMFFFKFRRFFRSRGQEGNSDPVIGEE